MFKRSLFLPAVFSLAIFACNNNSTTKTEAMKDTGQELVDRAKFADTINGKATALYTLKNDYGTELSITNFGGRFVTLLVPDKDGKPTNVIIGMESVNAFANAAEKYFGATIGPVTNRIAKGKFTIDGTEYTLAQNNGQNTLHGGSHGFQDVVWDASQPNDSSLVLTYLKPDMEGGFPGNLNVKVTFTLQDKADIHMDYEATTDKATPVNMTNHAFFNLNGAGSGDILGHTLEIFGDNITPVDSTLIPTGKLEPVANTPFDFTKPHTIGERIETDNEQLRFGKGYDHNYVLNGTKAANGLTHAARAKGDKSGIVLNVYTTEPALQFYCGNFMQSQNNLIGGFKDDFRTAFCLETQHHPDAPNQPNFPNTILRPGEVYKTSTVYSFAW